MQGGQKRSVARRFTVTKYGYGGHKKPCPPYMAFRHIACPICIRMVVRPEKGIFLAKSVGISEFSEFTFPYLYHTNLVFLTIPRIP